MSGHRSAPCGYFLLAAVLAVMPDACASAPEPAAPPAATQEMLESTRESVRATAEWLARGVDGWFGDKPFEDGGKVSDGRLSLSALKRQDQGMDSGLRFSAHFRLPNVEQHAYLFIGRDDQRDVVTDTPDAFSRQQRLLADRPEDRSLLAGIGLSLLDVVNFRLGVGAGLKPYAQVRYDQPWAFASGHLIDFRETVFWTAADHFGSTTALSYELAVAPTLAVRWLNATTITQVSRNFEWSSSLGAYKSLGAQRLLSLEVLFSGTGTKGSGVGLSDYGLLAKWEQPIHKDWLFGEIVGGRFWPRPNAVSERSRAWAIGGSLKMRF